MEEHKPKPLFWITVVVAVLGLTAYGLHRAGVFRGRGAERASAPVAAKSPSGTIELSFLSSSAKKNWIDRMVKEFNAAGHRVGGKAVVVKAAHGNSGDQLEALKQGTAKPDLWSPGDESWLELAAGYWKTVRQRELFDGYKPLVNIPLVITMWEPMARALGYPKPIGWADVARIAVNPAGWGSLGHPEWGKFRWGHAHPDANSGFLAVISQVYAALGKTEGITTDDLKSPRVVDFLRGFQGAVEHYGLSNTWIDDLMHAKGPSYLSSAVQYENTIIETNEKHQNRPFKLVAIYPREGNFWTRHPVAVFKEDWVSDEKREAAGKFVEFLLSGEAQSAAQTMGLRPIRVEGTLGAPFDEAHGVQATVDSSRAFKVPDEAVLKRIRDLWEDVKMPATVLLVLDRSGSMKGSAMDSAKAGAVEFVRSMKPRDQLQVVVFNQDISELGTMCAIRDCGERIAGFIEGIFAEGNTRLHDVVLHGYRRLRELKKTDPKRRYAMLVLSDGKDTSSQTSRNDFLDQLPKGEDYEVPKIYTIAYGGEADKELLGEVASRTNARLFTSSAGEITKTYKELSANF